MTLHPLALSALTSLAALLSLPALSHGYIDNFKVLVLTEARGHAHGSMPYGKTMMDKLAKEAGFTVVHAAGAGDFTKVNLAKYDVIALNNTTRLDRILNAEQKEAFRWYVEEFTGTNPLNKHGGVFTWHGGTDLEKDEAAYTWYATLLTGTYNGGFSSSGMTFSPGSKLTTANRVGADFPALKGVGEWKYDDEQYFWIKDPASVAKNKIVMYTDASKFPAGKAVQAISWCNADKKARVFATGLGHADGILKEPNVEKHFLGALKWAAGLPDNGVPVSLPPGQAPDNGGAEFDAKSLSLAFHRDIEHTVTLSDVEGRRVWEGKGKSAARYALSGRFRGGVYYLRIATPDLIETKRVALF